MKRFKFIDSQIMNVQKGAMAGISIQGNKFTKLVK